MIKRSQMRQFAARSTEILKKAGIVIRPDETIEIADFGLGEFERSGLSLVVYANNERYCGKEIILYPRQTCPEHRHPPVGTDPGKKETFRCRTGEVYLYVEGAPTQNILARVPKGSEGHYTVFHEIVLKPGDSYTIAPGIKHWFQAGDTGGIVTEFSSTSRDEADIFTDTRVERIPQIVED